MPTDWEWDEEDHQRRHDAKVDEAKEVLKQFFKQYPDQVFYERQLAVIFENKFYHWITSKALHELRTENRLASEIAPLVGRVSIRFYRERTHRFWKRQAKEIADLVRRFSEENFTRALGHQGELLFDAALPEAGFMPKSKKVRAYGGKQWNATGHDLDRVIERDGVSYGVEIKNTLDYIPRDEFLVKISMCRFLGLRPLFIVRMAPRTYIEELRQLGGFTLVFRYQLYPYTHGGLAKEVRERLQLPVDCPTRIQEGTIKRLLNWHLKLPPTQTQS